VFLAFLGASIGNAWLCYLGRISYGMYVFHLIPSGAAKVLLTHEFGVCPWWARGAIALPITIALAAVSYRWFEAPFLRMKSRLTRA
jgi:peptidoglycan/LPS O-acetylase OafA/YrhL